MRMMSYLYHRCFHVARGERLLYRTIYKLRPSRLLQVGLGDGERTRRMLSFAAGNANGEPLVFAGIDLFEARPSSDPGMSYQQAHRQLGRLVDQLVLVPGDPLSALARTANRLPDIDLLVISMGVEPGSLVQSWMYVPRMLHHKSIVLIEEPGPQRPCFRQLDRSEITELAAQGSLAKGRAA